MEKQVPKLGKYGWTYGLILGGVFVVFGLMLFSMDAHTSQNPANTVISVALMIAGIFMGLLAYRKANGGSLTIKDGLKLGAAIGLVSGLVYIVYVFLLSNVLDPGFAEKVTDVRLSEAVADGKLTTEQAAQQREMSIKFFWFGYPVILIFNVILGLIIGLVGGLIFKKQSTAG